MKRLSIIEASREAFRRRIIGTGYYEDLTDAELQALAELRTRTDGRSQRQTIMDFRNALIHAAPRWAPTRAPGPDSRLSIASDHARTGFHLQNVGRSREAADHMDVAADAYDEAGDHRSAMHAANMAALWRRNLQP